MTIFNDYAENGELLQTRDEPVSAENLERYIKEHGIEKAQGYLEAVRDMTKLLQNCLEKKRFPFKHGEIDSERIVYNSETII
jgi:hypothetical protein